MSSIAPFSFVGERLQQTLSQVSGDVRERLQHAKVTLQVLAQHLERFRDLQPIVLRNIISLRKPLEQSLDLLRDLKKKAKETARNPAWLPFCNVQFRMGQFLAKQGKDQWLVLVGKAPEEWYRAPQWVGEGMDVDRRSIV